MKILFATEGNSLKNKIAKRFGEAPYYIIYDTNTKEIKTEKNHGHDDGHTGLVDLVKSGVLHFIIGNTGPNAFDVLTNLDAKIYLARNIIAEKALALFLDDKLEQLTKATLKRPIRKK